MKNRELNIRVRSALSIALLLLIMPALGQSREGVPASGVTNIEGGFDDFGTYQPLLVGSFSQVPKRIRVKVMHHLAARIGPGFLQCLKFQNGEIIDRNRLYREDPDAKNDQWVIPTYRLNFVFVDRAKGIGRYCAQISLSSTGDVVDEVNLPDMHKYRSSYPVVSLFDAAKIAIKMGLDPDKISSEIVYMKKIDAVAWEFSEVVAHDAGSVKTRYIDINIYSGTAVNR